MASYKITLSASSWTQTTAELWWDTVSQRFYGNSALTVEEQNIVPPTRECFRFNGFFSATSGGVQYIDAAGNFTDAFFAKARTLTAALTINVQQTRVSWKLTLDPNGGSTTLEALYYRVEGGGYYTTDLCTDEPVTSVPRAVRANNAFRGYYNGTSTLGAKYIDKDGNYTSSLVTLELTENKKIYAAWRAPYKVTVAANGGTGGWAAFYYDSVNDLFYETPDVAALPITLVIMPARSGYASRGCWSTDGMSGVMCVDYGGIIEEDFKPSSAVTVYMQWELVAYKVTIDGQGGAGGTGALYYSRGIEGLPGWFRDNECREGASSIVFPTRSGYEPVGVYSAKTGGVEYITRLGEFLEAFDEFGAALAAAKTVYVRWSRTYKVTLDPQGGAGGTAAMWYSAHDGKLYVDAALSAEASFVDPPTRECFMFSGFYSATSGGTKYIADDGTFTQELIGLTITADTKFYARWVRISYKLTLNDNGGDGGSGAIYFDGEHNQFFADDMLLARVTAVHMPIRPGYVFQGYYSTSAASGGSRYIDEAGRIVVSTVLTASETVYARWLPLTFTLRFDYDGGRGSVQSKSVTMGSAVGSLPGATSDFGLLDGWYVGEKRIASTSVWNYLEDKVAVAKWRYYFANLTDWFGLETADGPLMLVASTDGATRSVTETSHSGALAIQTADSSVGAFERGGILLNPTCTYRIRKNGTVQIQLGKAWAKTGTVKSGYMIVSAEYATASDGEPVLVVLGAANEGADAINRWNVNISVNPDHIAQDPMGAVSGGGEMTECKTLVTCDPVVPMENGMPCASDVVHGKVVVTATTNAYLGESAPTASGSFIETNGDPNSETDVDFITYSFKAERSL